MLTGIQLADVAKEYCRQCGLDPAELVIGENDRALPRWRAMLPQIRRYERIIFDVLATASETRR